MGSLAFPPTLHSLAPLDVYNIDIYMQKIRPQGQQIVVSNMDELMPFLTY